jgi:hypothetical protein
MANNGNNGNNAWDTVEFHNDNTAGINPNSVKAFIESSKKEEDAIIKREIEAQAREAARKKARSVRWKNSVKKVNKETLTTKRRQVFPSDEEALAYMSSPSQVARRNAMQEKRALEAQKQNKRALEAQQQNNKGGSYRRKKATRKNRKH